MYRKSKSYGWNEILTIQNFMYDLNLKCLSTAIKFPNLNLVFLTNTIRRLALFFILYLSIKINLSLKC